MIKVGVTGGIGSGKTVVSNLLNNFGYPVYDSDKNAKKLMNFKTELISKIIYNFGPNSYVKNKLNSKYLASEVFTDRKKLELLNKIVHPFVKEDFLSWTKCQYSNIVFKESALIFELGLNQELDYSVLIISPKELKIQRLIERDNLNRKEVLERMENQWSDDKKQKYADFKIINDNKTLLTNQVLVILDKIKSFIKP